MIKDVGELIARLSKEKFNGEKIEWQKTNLDRIPVKYVKDRENGYVLKGNVIYVQKISGGDFTCFVCGSDILSATVAHSIWDRPGPCSGSGKVKYEEVPYCPKCEKKPNYHGIPITANDDFN